MSEPILTQIFGANATQSSTDIVIRKSDLTGLTASSDNSAESLLVAILLKVKSYLTQTNNEGETNHIERFNNTLRQRCSTLVRKGRSFSKNFFNHLSAIYYFINNYNQEILLINNSFTT